MGLTARKLDREGFASLYETNMKADFEGHGLKPFDMMQKMAEQGYYDCLGMFEGGELRGYACLVREPERGYLLLDYLAVCSWCRDSGYGGKILEKLREYYAGEKGIFLESESVCAAPDEAEEQVCMRRIRFYQRHGCVHTRVKSWLFGHEYDIFYIPLLEEQPDIEQELHRIYQRMGLGKLYKGNVRIWSRRSRLLGVHGWSGEDLTDSVPGQLSKTFWTERPSLTRALMPSGSLPAVISLVGAGGKTTTMYQLADELAEQGKRVLVTTTTHIQCPGEGEGPYARIRHIREVRDLSWTGNILTVGKWVRPEEESGRATAGGGVEASGRATAGDGVKPSKGAIAGEGVEASGSVMVSEGSGTLSGDSGAAQGKLGMPDGLGDPEAMEELMGCVDVVLIEADGAKLLPAKVPEAWEPVIIPQTGMVIACAGLGALGQTFRDACFRFATAGGWLRREAEDPIEPEDLALILMDERGSHRQVAGRYYRIVLNQADGETRKAQAAQVLAALPVTMQQGCVITSYA